MNEILRGRVTGLYLGDRPGVEKTPVGLLVVSAEGIVGDRHAGLTRRSGVRDKGVPKGTELPNDRQWSAVSLEETQKIAEAMGVEDIDPGWLGTNLTIEGISDFSRLPEGSQLIFPNATLTVSGENTPCIGPGEVIAKYLNNTDKKFPSSFVRAAWGRRGVIGFVPKKGQGTISVDDPVEVIIFQ